MQAIFRMGVPVTARTYSVEYPGPADLVDPVSARGYTARTRPST
jgi:hypothetical protein